MSKECYSCNQVIEEENGHFNAMGFFCDECYQDQWWE